MVPWLGGDHGSEAPERTFSLATSTKIYPYLRAQWRRLFGLNLSAIEPQLFVGGQFSAAQWPLIQALGVRAVLSLQRERVDDFAGAPPEQALRLAVTDFSAPSLAQLGEGAAFVAACRAAGLPVLIHCRAGVGRAPLLAAAYLMQTQGLSHGQAIALLRAARPIVAPNRHQLARLREFEASLGGAA